MQDPTTTSAPIAPTSAQVVGLLAGAATALATAETIAETFIEERIGDLESELATLEAFIDTVPAADDDDDDDEDDEAAADPDAADDPEEIEAAKQRIEDITDLLDRIHSALADGAYGDALDAIECAP